jgi:hypothetical protein
MLAIAKLLSISGFGVLYRETSYVKTGKFYARFAEMGGSEDGSRRGRGSKRLVCRRD